MRKSLLTLLTILAFSSVSATDLSVVYIDTILAADTAITNVRADTVYTGSMDFGKWRYMQFYVDLQATGQSVNVDTNWAADTFFVDVQHSFDRVNWVTVEVDTLLTSGTGVPVLNIDRDGSVVGNWLRGRFIHWDSMETTQPSLLNNKYEKKMILYINGSN